MIPLDFYGCWDVVSLTRLQTDGVFITACKQINQSRAWAEPGASGPLGALKKVLTVVAKLHIKNVVF